MIKLDSNGNIFGHEKLVSFVFPYISVTLTKAIRSVIGNP